jgi:exodeoxyribonuclease V alpha subunit
MQISRVMACAPTGKAAVVLSDYFSGHGVTLKARTIHGTLGPTRNVHDGDGWGFDHGESNPLPCDLLIVDESSMVDAGLMAQLLAAVPDDGRVLLVGDPNQLPPVGPGKPLIDLIASGRIPHGHLGTAHRYAGRIAAVCGAIHRGEKWEPSPSLDLEAEYPENFKHIERPTVGVQVRTMLTVVDRMRGKGFDPIDDMQIVTALNEKGGLCRKILNKHLQRHLNPDGKRVDKFDLRVGDKIICLRNGVRPASDDINADPDDCDDAYVANGETGRVIDINKKSLLLSFGEERYVVVGRTGWKDFDLGYAITTHKSQGGGWPVVIAMIDDSGGARFLADRSLHYTALSRAKTVLFTIGRLSELQRQCRKVKVVNRRTHLQEKLNERMG